MAKYGEYVEVDFDRCLVVTDGAVKLVVRGEEKWIPQNCIDPDEMPTTEDVGSCTFVKEWFALQEGLI